MKHKLITFLFLFALGFSFNLITPTDSKALAFGCKKDADGAIIVQRLSTNFFDLTSGTASDQCSEEPDFYKVLIYKVALCREDPYTAGGGVLPNYDNCVVLDEDFTKTDADATIIQPGVEANLAIPAQSIPVGAYPYAILVVNSKIRVKHTQTYAYKAGLATHKGVRGFEAIAGSDNDDLGNGEINTVCWTLEKVTTLHNDAYDANTAYPLAHGLGDSTAVIEPQANQATSTIQCGRAAGTAQYATELIDDLRNEDSDPFKAHEDYFDVFDDTGIRGIDLAALLLKDAATISDGLNNSRLINIFYRYATPVVIKENTTGLNIRIKTSSAISLDYSWDNTNKAMWGSKVGANAFTPRYVTNTRRSRGAWN